MALTRGRALALGTLMFVLVLAVGVSVAVGSVTLPLPAVFFALTHPHDSNVATQIVWALRLPRVLIAALVGAALAASGTLLQGMLRNGLADPSLTGGSAGAALAIAVAIALGAPTPSYAGIAFAAALATTVGVATLARGGGGIARERLVLAGIAVSLLLGGLTSLIIQLVPSANVKLNILAWLWGSLVGHGWRDLMWAALYALAGLAVALTAVPALNAIRLGDARARALGVDLERTRWIVLGASSLLIAAAVSVSGVIGFVGLIVPHVVRAMCGSDARWALPASLPAGAVIVVLTDAVARSADPPNELPIGVLLSLLGIPAFLFIAFRRERPA